MILQKYTEYVNRIAAGLVGEGSECLGYDDEYSTDHDYGVGCCLWILQQDYDIIGKQLLINYQNLLKNDLEYPPRNTTVYGSHRVGVFSIDDFYQMLTGYKKAPATLQEWKQITEERLCIAVNEKIFEDKY